MILAADLSAQIGIQNERLLYNDNNIRSHLIYNDKENKELPKSGQPSKIGCPHLFTLHTYTHTHTHTHIYIYIYIYIYIQTNYMTIPMF